MNATTTKTLSDVPSEFLQQALEDYDVVSKGERYKLEMWVWHRPHPNGMCEICLGGAVMANRLGVDFEQDKDADQLSWMEGGTVTQKLWAIDSFRTGDINGGLMNVDIERGYIPSVEVADHDKYPAAWRSDMNRVVAALKEANL